MFVTKHAINAGMILNGDNNFINAQFVKVCFIKIAFEAKYKYKVKALLTVQYASQYKSNKKQKNKKKMKKRIYKNITMLALNE